MSIGRLQIRGYQRHTQFRVRLDPACTTFTGATEAGKTSILRAIRWWATNRPIGDEYINWGTDTAEVKGEIDGHVLIRRRSPAFNGYILDGKWYRALGRDVPPAVAAVLNVRDVNFQWQQDPAFWFSASALEVSRQLNAIVNLEIIDRTLTNINRTCNRAGVLLEEAEAQYATACETAKTWAWVPAVAEAWDEVVWATTAAANKRARAAAVGTLVVRAGWHHAAATAANRAARCGATVVGLAATARKARARADAIAAAVAVARVKPVRVPGVAPLEVAFRRARTAREHQTRMSRLVHTIASHNGAAADANERLQRATAELDKMCEGRCPTCGEPLKK